MKALMVLCLLVLVLETMAATLTRPEEENLRANLKDFGGKKRADPQVENKRDDGDPFKRSTVENKRDDGDPFKRSEVAKRSEPVCDPAGIRLWGDGIVPYAFCNSDVENPEVVGAIAELAEKFKDILTFKKLTNIDCDNPGDAGNFIAFNNKDDGCWSFIGEIGAAGQTLNVETPGCNSIGVVMHEILHAIGLYHTQQRPDASNNIDINMANVKAGKEGNFQPKDGMCTTCKYQTCSLMHYRKQAFSSNGQNTIDAKESAKVPDMGKQKYVSASDFCAVYLLYAAREKESECDPAICEFGTGNEFHFKCCRCNEHLEGADCGTMKKVHPDDSETVLAAGGSEILSSKDLNNDNQYDPDQKITHLVRAPKSCKIQVEVLEFNVEYDPECYWDQFHYWAANSLIDCPNTICGTDAAQLNLVTSSYFFMMAFVSDQFYQESGYKIKFTAVQC